MKKRLISIILVVGLCLFTAFGTTASASEKGLWFVYTSFGAIDHVELVNVDTGDVITLNSDEIFDFETFDFIDTATKTIEVTKFYTDGTVIKQDFEIYGAKEIIGIYDDGTTGESWLEVDRNYTY